MMQRLYNRFNNRTTSFLYFSTSNKTSQNFKAGSNNQKQHQHLGDQLVRVIDADGKMRPDLHQYNRILQSLDPKQFRLVRIEERRRDSDDGATLSQNPNQPQPHPLFRITSLAQLNQAAMADRKAQLRNRLSTRVKTIQFGTSIGPADLARKIEHLCGPAVLGRAVRARILVEPKGDLARSLAIQEQLEQSTTTASAALKGGGVGKKGAGGASVGAGEAAAAAHSIPKNDKRHAMMQHILGQIEGHLGHGDMSLISGPCLEGRNLVAIVASASAIPPPCRPKEHRRNGKGEEEPEVQEEEEEEEQEDDSFDDNNVRK